MTETIYFAGPDAEVRSIHVDFKCNAHDIQRKIALAVGASTQSIFRLVNEEGDVLGLGPNIPPNSANAPYKLEIRKCTFAKEPLVTTAPNPAIVGDISDMRAALEKLRVSLEPKVRLNEFSEDRAPKPSIKRLREFPQHVWTDPVPTPAEFASAHTQFSAAELEHMKDPTFDVLKYSEDQLILLFEEMFIELGLLSTFKIDVGVLRRFLRCIQVGYNANPFHNFRHCFCVTQMMYALIHVTSLVKKLTQSERLSLVAGCIGHDLDHPGVNNAYQINAMTELAIVYNDTSPLENHHCAMLFTILKRPETNILKQLTDAEFKEVRKHIINCILATDMAKHGEIVARFKSFAESFNVDDPAHRTLLLQMIVKCSDISNEVRPQEISEPWVDNLLEEFFQQSDKEKLEGLPTAPFMDRKKVTKSSAQVGFIGFVMIPLFELIAKVLPNLEQPVLQPIKAALDYYKSLTK
ncbi:hypothetical protein BJ742DRAFT_803675 [Cladochytrium replicatum]|nr:hypothetical protein BJ742DRAFT_803675 [Cladochytrium replicatum]